MPTTAALMTTEELFALPLDGVNRWLIAGRLRERATTKKSGVQPKIIGDRSDCQPRAFIGMELGTWLRKQPSPTGAILRGAAGVRLQRDPDTTLSPDLVYVSVEVMLQQADESSLIDGVPILAVEILSPKDTFGQINERLHAYLGAGVSLVWIVDTDLRTVTVHRRSGPEIFGARQEITCEPELPGFRAPVARFFE